jgi:hypothetical protein
MAHALTQPLRAIRLGASLCLCACGAVAVDGQKVEAALRAVQDQPKAAAEICAGLPSGRWRGECVISAVERLAVSQPALAEGLCAQLEEDDGGVEAHECWFQLAERSHDVALCVRSGSFVEDCRIHVWTARVPTLTSAQAAEGATLEPALAGLALAAAGHNRPWLRRTGLAAALYFAAVAKRSEWASERQLWPIYGHLPLRFIDAYAMNRTFESLEPYLGFGNS